MTTRRLAAILAADVAGFSTMMERDEEGTARQIRALRTDVIEPLLAKHHGRLVKTTGDGFLAEFASPVEAVRSALAIQDQLTSASDVNPVKLRIGINLGDIIIEDDGDVFGDGVNVAARLEQMAEPGGIAISGWIHDQVVGKIDRSFEDRGEQQVKNIARPVRVYVPVGAAPSRSEPDPLRLPDKPSIAVLPFTNMSGDPEQEYFGDGVVEDIISALSRFRALFVIARNSTFAYKGRAVDVRQVGRELGVRYVLEGSIRKAANQVRISGQLIDAAQGVHLWAERFDGSLDDIFGLQEKVAAQVAAAIEPTITRAELGRAATKPTSSLSAYDLYLRALARHHHGGESGLRDAVALGQEALALDPHYSVAKALIANSLGLLVLDGWGATDDAHVALRLAHECLDQRDDDPVVLRLIAPALARLGGKHDLAVALADRALLTQPNSAPVLWASGWVRLYSGDPTTAIQQFEQAMRLSPRDPETCKALSGVAVAQLMIGGVSEALSLARQSVYENPNWLTGYKLEILSLFLLGRTPETAQIGAELLRRHPSITVRTELAAVPVRDPKLLPLYAQALKAAGIPE